MRSALGTVSRFIAGYPGLGRCNPVAAASFNSRYLSSQPPPKDTQKELAESITKEVAVRQSLETMLKDVDKFRSLPRDQIEQLWADFHKDKPFSLAGKPLDPISWIKLKERATASSFFVLPVVRSKDSFFVLLTEYKEEFVLMTFLDDYRRIGANASPWCSIRFFPEIEHLALVQTKFSPYLTRDDASRLTEQWIKFYTEDKLFENVFRFNKKPETFDFNSTFSDVINGKP